MKRRLEGHGTDKKESNYLARYEEYFHNLIDEEISLFELGIFNGDSLLMWRDYFARGTIVGIDVEHVQLNDSTGRIHVYQGLQQDNGLLDRIRKETAEDGFDIIIDDASHIGELTSLSFWYLFNNHLKPGGIYVIEDWRTGYWGKWPDGKQYVFGSERRSRIKNYVDSLLNRMINDGDADQKKVIVRKILNRIRNRISSHRLKSHDYGMVGFIKQLVDELGMDMITNSERGSKVPFRESRFAKMEIFPGQVFIVKNPNEAIPEK